MQPLALDFEESPPIIATMWRGRPHNELQSWYKWRTKPDHYIGHNLNIFSPGRDSATENRLQHVGEKNSAWNSDAAMVYAKVKRRENYVFESYVATDTSFSSLYFSRKTHQQASSQQGLRGNDRGEAEQLSIQMTRQTPHHHPAEDHFPKTSINGGIAVMALIFLTFMSSITRRGLSDGAVAG